MLLWWLLVTSAIISIIRTCARAGNWLVEPMDGSSGVETSFSSSQTPQAVENHKDTFIVVTLAPDRDNTPLLDSDSNDVDTEEKISLNKSKRRRWNWKSLILLVVLWFVVLFIGAAYSMIAPFFPEQVIIRTIEHLSSEHFINIAIMFNKIII